MLNEKEMFSVRDFAEMQTDQKSWMVMEFLPDILNVINSVELTEPEKTGKAILSGWNGVMEEDSPAPLIFEKTYHKIVWNILSDELGEDLYEEYYHNASLSRNFIENIWMDNGVGFWDDINTPDKKEEFSDIVIKSYKEVIVELVAEMGDDPEKWQWGDVHQLTLEHPLGKVKMLDKIFGFNRGPYRVGGSFHTVCPYSYSFSTPFKVGKGASHRHIYSAANWNESLSVIPTGESGIPASEHYCDQTELYLENMYHSDPFSINEVEAKLKYMTVFSGSK